MGIRGKPTAPASPWQNGFAERLIGSIRRARVDHIILKSYADYYKGVRTHRSLNKDAPETDSRDNEQVHRGNIRRVIRRKVRHPLAWRSAPFDHVFGDA
jgi:hypothetical protein